MYARRTGFFLEQECNLYSNSACMTKASFINEKNV